MKHIFSLLTFSSTLFASSSLCKPYYFSYFILLSKMQFQKIINLQFPPSDRVMFISQGISNPHNPLLQVSIRPGVEENQKKSNSSTHQKSFTPNAANLENFSQSSPQFKMQKVTKKHEEFISQQKQSISLNKAANILMQGSKEAKCTLSPKETHSPHCQLMQLNAVRSSSRQLEQQQSHKKFVKHVKSHSFPAKKQGSKEFFDESEINKETHQQSQHFPHSSQCLEEYSSKYCIVKQVSVMYIPELNFSNVIGMKNPPQIFNKFNLTSRYRNQLDSVKGNSQQVDGRDMSFPLQNTKWIKLLDIQLLVKSQELKHHRAHELRQANEKLLAAHLASKYEIEKTKKTLQSTQGVNVKTVSSLNNQLTAQKERFKQLESELVLKEKANLQIRRLNEQYAKQINDLKAKIKEYEKTVLRMERSQKLNDNLTTRRFEQGQRIVPQTQRDSSKIIQIRSQGTINLHQTLENNPYELNHQHNYSTVYDRQQPSTSKNQTKHFNLKGSDDQSNPNDRIRTYKSCSNISRLSSRSRDIGFIQKAPQIIKNPGLFIDYMLANPTIQKPDKPTKPNNRFQYKSPPSTRQQ